tara:strand:+ start:1079 stop:1594 length:516 start_codon:yes stop_codon:yes gene_type:complete
MNEKKEAYIRVAIAMAKAGEEDLLATKSHSGYFLRGIIDYSTEGKKANLKHNYAPQTYSYSIEASKLKYTPSAYKDRQNKSLMAEKLHAEHVIPNGIIFRRFVEMSREGYTDDELANFLRLNCEVVVITKREQKILDGKDHCNLKDAMPQGWSWDDSRFARLDIAGIEIER